MKTMKEFFKEIVDSLRHSDKRKLNDVLMENFGIDVLDECDWTRAKESLW